MSFTLGRIFALPIEHLFFRLQLKLAAQLSDQPNFSWAGEMTLAMALGENVVRLWDIAKSDNYTLSPDLDASILKKKTVNVQSLTYCSKHSEFTIFHENQCPNRITTQNW